MAVYGCIVTAKGHNLLAKLLTGQKLNYTRIMVGKGRTEEDLVLLDDLVDSVAAASSTEPYTENNVCSFIIEYRNDMNGGLQTGFWLSEYGVFAEDPEQGEILFCYGCLGDYPQYVSAYRGEISDIRRYPVSISLSTALEVKAVYPLIAWMTAEDTAKAINAFAKNLDASNIKQNAIAGEDGKPISVNGALGSLNEKIENIDIDINIDEFFNSPKFTGVPECPTPNADSKDTHLANKGYVDIAVESAINMTIRLEITFMPSLSGKSFTVTSVGSEYSGTVPADYKATVPVSMLNTTYTITCNGISGYVTTGSSFGIYSTPFPTTLANFTWAQIGEILAAGLGPTYFQSGDEKPDKFTTGETFTARIEDFGHDDLADGSGKAKITFGMIGVYEDGQRLNQTATNIGSWSSSDLRKSMSTYLNKFPPDLKALIKPVSKKTTAGNQSTSFQYRTDSLWPFSCAELGVKGGNPIPVGEGNAYPLFIDNSSRIKYRKTTSGSLAAAEWYTRSPSIGDSERWISVKTDGIASIRDPNQLHYICLGFCL